MRFDFNHELEFDDARTRLRALGEYLANRYGMTVQWADDSASISGKYMLVRIEGTLTVGRDQIACRGKDPGMLWRKKATDYVRKKLTQYLDPSVAVESLPRS